MLIVVNLYTTLKEIKIISLYVDITVFLSTRKSQHFSHNKILALIYIELINFSIY